MKLNKLLFKGILRTVFNDTLWSVIGIVVGVILAFVFYFSGQIDKATFWIIAALLCIMNIKE